MNLLKKPESNQQNNENTEEECPDLSTQVEKSNNDKEKNGYTKVEGSKSSIQMSSSCIEKKEDIPRKCIAKVNEFNANEEENINETGTENNVFMNNYICEVCEENFATEIDLERHQLRYINLRRNICKPCNKSFTDEEYKQHVLEVHMDVLPYICHYCKETFRQKENLRDHLKLHKSKNYIRNTRFSKKSSNGHIHLQLEEESYLHGRESSELKIEIKHYRSLDKRILHKECINLLIDEKYEQSHKCLKCGKYFYQKSDLKKHVFTKQCSEESPSTTSQQKETQYEYNHYPETFSRKQDLEHKKLYTGGKKYKCKDCSKFFDREDVREIQSSTEDFEETSYTSRENSDNSEEEFDFENYTSDEFSKFS
ncbi:zinc finger protein 225-like [Nylanderia fulva]|uniref:zinc finger protein 225-like n=1 Tax=Nylanderia fulva TaxID=613905 RepID=UPI0010FB81F6|nr:zinc finger protein 225-like [Nylanderia fulva]